MIQLYSLLGIIWLSATVHAINPFTSCRSYPEPSMVNLVNSINDFFDVVDLDVKGLSNTIKFLRQYACTDIDRNFTVTTVNIRTLNSSDLIQCSTMHNILDIVYDNLREVSYLGNNKSFDPMDLKYPRDQEPTIKEVKENQIGYEKMETPMHEFFVGLWITSGVYVETMCDVTRPIIKHLEMLLSDKTDRKGRSDLDIIEKQHLNCDKLNVHAEVTLAILPRMYLDMKARLGELWLTLRKGTEDLINLVIYQLVQTLDRGLANLGINMTEYQHIFRFGKMKTLSGKSKQPYYYSFDVNL